MTSQLTRVCVVCGGRAQNTHHGRPHDLSQGKGMGGTSLDEHEHFVFLDLCTYHHDAVHAKYIGLERGEMVLGFWAGVEDGSLIRTVDRQNMGWTLSIRPISGEYISAELESAIDTSDLLYVEDHVHRLADDAVAEIYHAGRRQERNGLLRQALAVYVIWVRYGQFPSSQWREKAQELVAGQSGEELSLRTIDNRLKSYISLLAIARANRDLDVEQGVYGKTLLTEAGMHPDPVQALVLADSAMAEGKDRRGAAAVMRRERLGLPDPCADGHEYVMRCLRCGKRKEESQ